jgi:hypothetical protein
VSSKSFYPGTIDAVDLPRKTYVLRVVSHSVCDPSEGSSLRITFRQHTSNSGSYLGQIMVGEGGLSGAIL